MLRTSPLKGGSDDLKRVIAIDYVVYVKGFQVVKLGMLIYCTEVERIRDVYCSRKFMFLGLRFCSGTLMNYTGCTLEYVLHVQLHDKGRLESVPQLK